MINKTQSLERLDGKPVRYSTITSQFPDVFVNRKRNTGEIIVTTDTDPEYGMHHIYAGGEHIACGYGFATPETRDDLVYIQETYIGTFNYFNNAYTYFSNAYKWTYSYMIDSYAYCLDRIAYNSYLNTTIDKTNNEIKFDGYEYSYYLDFNKEIGQLSLNYNVYPKAELSFNNITNEVLLNLLHTDYDNKQKAKFTINVKFTQNTKRYESLDASKIVIYLNDVEQKHIGVTTIDNDNVSFEIYIEKNVDSTIHIDYTITDTYKDNKETITKKSNTLNFVWVYPIYTICTNDISKSNINIDSLKRYSYLFTNYKGTNNLYINDIPLTYTYGTDNPQNRICMLLPKKISSPKFYISFDNTKRGDLEGGMCFSSYIDSNVKLDDKLSANYNYYCSSYYYIDKNIRVDVTW